MIRRLTRRFGAGLVRARVYLVALWKLARHPQAPRAARWVALAVLAYALSPIDLIPDFIPVLGLLDDALIVPLGIALAVWLTPKPLWQRLLQEVQAAPLQLPAMRWGALLVVLMWLVLIVSIGLVAWGLAAWLAAR